MGAMPPEHDLRPRWVRVVDAIGTVVKPVFIGATVAVSIVVYIGLALLAAFGATVLVAVTALRFVPSDWYWTATEACFVVAVVAFLASPKLISKMLGVFG